MASLPPPHHGGGGSSSSHGRRRGLPVMNNISLLKSRRGVTAIHTIVWCVATAAISFYLGVLWGMHIGVISPHKPNGMSSYDSLKMEEIVQSRVKEEMTRYKTNMEEQQQPKSNNNNNNKGNSSNKRFPNTVSTMVTGMGRVNRDEFAKAFDVGVPLDKTSEGNEEVLILYKDKSLPKDKRAEATTSAASDIPLFHWQEATENCDFLNIILTDHNKKRKQCIAVMGQYEAFHIQKFMRLPQVDNSNLPGVKPPGVESKVPLRYVNRGAQANGRKSHFAPTPEQSREYWKILQTYIGSLQQVLEELKPIAQKVAGNNHKNTIIVMVCNHGQSELLMNFVCSAKSRGLDTSSVLLFATDQETKKLAEGMGITTFYDETNFGRMPEKAARFYLDRNFIQMMMGKVFCVQMVTMLGYDVLFQDVDVVWFKDPLEYFHDETSPVYNFDIYFQDDGNHANYYAPYSANTGFYYIRHNERTQYFFNSFLLAGDLILANKSHQVALISVLNEHASMYGMKVKTLSRETDDFPGGFHYHHRKPFMKAVMSGKIIPYVFHMCWTQNKMNKIRFFQQMGEWYLEGKCTGSTVDKIDGGGTADDLASSCCLAEPIVKCHYRDKPSKIPCRDSPPIDKDRPSFW